MDEKPTRKRRSTDKEEEVEYSAKKAAMDEESPVKELPRDDAEEDLGGLPGEKMEGASRVKVPAPEKETPLSESPPDSCQPHYSDISSERSTPSSELLTLSDDETRSRKMSMDSQKSVGISKLNIATSTPPERLSTTSESSEASDDVAEAGAGKTPSIPTIFVTAPTSKKIKVGKKSKPVITLTTPDSEEAFFVVPGRRSGDDSSDTDTSKSEPIGKQSDSDLD